VKSETKTSKLIRGRRGRRKRRQNTKKKCGNKEGKVRKEKEMDRIRNTNSTKLN